MASVIRLSKGLDVVLQGKAENVFSKCDAPLAYAVQSTDFQGVVPQLLVQQGDAVKAGTALFCDGLYPQIRFTSPVSGVVASIENPLNQVKIIISPDEQNEFETFAVPPIEQIDRPQIVSTMLQSGAWAFLVQRPFGVIAAPDAVPNNIFISGFDTAPLAADADFLVNGEGDAFQAGINVLRQLTKGKVYLSLCADYPANKVLERARGVEIVRFKGKHPAGNVGVQIHHIAPISKGDVVWTIAPQHVIALGKLFTQGIYDVSKVIALVGSEVKKPRYYRMMAGASLSVLASLLQPSATPQRIISGHVLTGANAGLDGYLGFYHNEITVIPEGNAPKFLGWLLPGVRKFSHSRICFSWWMPRKQYKLNTLTNGSTRPLVMSGEYERVLPMDILPTYLLKAIMEHHIERAEQLGIYEVIEEDLALCEFVCTSKINVQAILRQGIDELLIIK
ncbi:Na(+)-translocating NADH-quinone reductase subunit A [Bacteroidia bacterium]|nr:Na(+)-translocating NADH-quinone reductase subunit A [Bacteroidia bacterium]